MTTGPFPLSLQQHTNTSHYEIMQDILRKLDTIKRRLDLHEIVISDIFQFYLKYIFSYLASCSFSITSESYLRQGKNE